MIEVLMKIVDDTPENRVYTYNLRVVNVACQILKFVIRPRNEEQYDLLRRFEKKIMFETDNLSQEFTTAFEEEDFS